MSNDDLLEDSDSSDEDYVPDAKSNEQLSEEDSDGNVEKLLSDNEEITGKTTKRRKRKTTKSRKKQKTDIDEEEDEAAQIVEKKELNEEDKKKKDDDLWADFLKDTGFKSKNSNNEIKTQQKPNPNEQQKSTTTVTTTTKPDDKVKITQIFDFAGEEVKVEKEVSRNSAEARLLNKTTTPETSSNSNNSNKVRTKGGLSGIGNVLSQLGKKPKISTLEKSKLDWDQFKKEENLEEELRTFNKGKDGYLEKQDFLQRADLRRFEIEKEIRSVERSKRLNN